MTTWCLWMRCARAGVSSGVSDARIVVSFHIRDGDTAVEHSPNQETVEVSTVRIRCSGRCCHRYAFFIHHPASQVQYRNSIPLIDLSNSD